MAEKRIGVVVHPSQKDFILKALKQIGYEGKVEVLVSTEHSENFIGIGSAQSLERMLKTGIEQLEKYKIVSKGDKDD